MRMRPATTTTTIVVTLQMTNMILSRLAADALRQLIFMSITMSQ